tara:strand:- start:23 stop:514 length:492 start_codon:yes stop_codon:yes gene_type:complete
MNIFALDKCPVKSAQLQHDKHVVKMVLESAQMLCSAFDREKFNVPYKWAHYNHPCTIWSRTNQSNFDWLANHGMALAKEYTHRYNKIHKSQAVIEWCIGKVKQISLPKEKITLFSQCMPDKYKNDNHIQAYRDYYIDTKLSSNPRWTNRPTPPIFEPYLLINA